MPGTTSKLAYPNLCETFKRVRLTRENRKLSNEFVNYEKVFINNLDSLNVEKV